jgi:leucyl aminopeptidase (aminopeptidase T)
MRMIMGKTPNYDVNGKLKNTVVIPKFTGEKELSDLLTDDAYKALGVCEISCIECYDAKDVKAKDKSRMDEVNKSIKAVKQKAKSKVQLLEEENQKLKEQSKSVMERLEALEKGNDKSENRVKLEEKANELEITFRANIGDVKLLEKINEKDKEFKL